MKKFLPFLKEVWGLKYDEKPNYNKLKFMLVSILLDLNEVPQMNLIKDWNSIDVIAPEFQERKVNFTGNEFDQLMVAEENIYCDVPERNK